MFRGAEVQPLHRLRKAVWADDAPFKIVAVLPLDELDGETAG